MARNRMRPYGMARMLQGMQYPDCVDVSTYGLKSRYGRCRHKRQTRRRFKRQARKEGRSEALTRLDEEPVVKDPYGDYYDDDFYDNGFYGEYSEPFKRTLFET